MQGPFEKKHMPQPLSKSLHAVLEGYLVGRAKKTTIQNNPAVSGESFEKYIYATIQPRLSLREQLYLYQCQAMRDQGLLAAQKGDLTAADRFFQSAESLLHSQKLSHESFLFGKAYYEAGAAYLDYKRNDFNRAIARVHEALVCDFTLEEEYGYAILHLHRLQLVHNLMRVYKRRMFIKDALDIGYQLLDYIERKSNTLPAPTDWDSSRLLSLPYDLVEMAFVQVTFEIAMLIAGNEALSTQNFFRGAQLHTQATMNSSCSISPQCHTWLRAKQALVDRDLIGFLKEAEPCLADGPQDTPWIWHAILADLVALCCRLDLPEANIIRQNVAKDTRMGMNIPPIWRSLYSSGENASE